MLFGQVANFKTNSSIPIEKFAIAINSNLKKSILIQSAEEVDEKFHSRLSCKRKTYRYVINNSKIGTAIYRNLETHIPIKLDKAEIREQKNQKIWIELTGNGFLYNMVRIIAGTLVEVGLGNIKPEEIATIIEEKDRTKAGKTLPPQGLYLVKVEYD